jgi:CheY-like chemotaxis protein
MGFDRRILLVEDDPATRDALTLVLGLEGYQVTVAADGKEALDLLRRQEPPGLILLDLLTPVMDGWQFRREQAADPKLADIPVVIISGADHVEHEAASLGAAGYIRKPVEAGTLVATVRLVAAPRQAGVLVVEHQDAMRNLIAGALRHHGFKVHAASTGRQALELTEKHSQDIALVVWDARLEAEEGPGTLAALRRLNPQVRCCVISGQAAEQLRALAEGRPSPSLAEAARILRQLACLS